MCVYLHMYMLIHIITSWRGHTCWNAGGFQTLRDTLQVSRGGGNTHFALPSLRTHHWHFLRYPGFQHIGYCTILLQPFGQGLSQIYSSPRRGNQVNCLRRAAGSLASAITPSDFRSTSCTSPRRFLLILYALRASDLIHCERGNSSQAVIRVHPRFGHNDMRADNVSGASIK